MAASNVLLDRDENGVLRQVVRRLFERFNIATTKRLDESVAEIAQRIWDGA